MVTLAPQCLAQGMVHESELELRKLGRGQGALEASGKRSQNTQRDSFTFSFLTALSPHTVDYCLSYKLFKRRWHGHGLATQWTNHLAF
ncbi:LOW QUALITY PROTEIN: putative cancer susceptibility gene HEPN1 protein [Sus scrofa]|uniref:LOW QUALITY PROTEIN: putative cancer susceptibility gene HEPN1 protein n=1 Tax=Sus scrofa TaxID=9823 RepID=UPI000A2B916C|nr:LOW QUALITY PROTEIN: putative cancer susceptibility gene HEPN1 protein [Sus scrofa]